MSTLLPSRQERRRTHYLATKFEDFERRAIAEAYGLYGAAISGGVARADFGATHLVLAVHAASTARTLQELVAAAPLRLTVRCAILERAAVVAKLRATKHQPLVAFAEEIAALEMPSGEVAYIAVTPTFTKFAPLRYAEATQWLAALAEAQHAANADAGQDGAPVVASTDDHPAE